MQSGAAGRAWVDEVVADWALAERCFARLPAIPATVLSDQALQDLKVPTLYLVGENEKVYPARKALERLNRVAPQMKTRLIPQAGHDLWIAQADLVTQTMLDFFADGETPSPAANPLPSRA